MEYLAELNISTCLKERIEFATPYVDVSRFRKLKILTLSDVILQVHVEFSEDGDQLGSHTLYRIASGVWKCEEIVTQMTYMRIRVVNQCGKPNERLTIKVTPVKLNEIYQPDASRLSSMSSRGLGGSTDVLPSFSDPSIEPIKSEPKQDASKQDLSKQDSIVAKIEAVEEEPKKEQEPIEEKKKRFKSPFSLRKSSSKLKSNKDYRIPEIVPKGCILFGGNNGSIQALPLGNPGDVLIINDQGLPEWSKLSFPAYKALPSVPCPTGLPPPLAKSNSSGSAPQPTVVFDLNSK